MHKKLSYEKAIAQLVNPLVIFFSEQIHLESCCICESNWEVGLPHVLSIYACLIMADVKSENLGLTQPTQLEWGSMAMLCVRFSEGHRSPCAPRKVKWLPPATERSQEENRKDPYLEQQRGTSGSKMHPWTSCVTSAIYSLWKFGTWTYLLYSYGLLFTLTLVDLYKISEKLWPRFTCSLNISFWKDKVGPNLHIISQHLKIGNFFYIYYFIWKICLLA